jgi:hypothetical protein
MLPFFPNPYPDELVYSAIARYHFYSGNIDWKDTLEETLGSRSLVSSVGIGSNFSFLVSQLGKHYSVEQLLANHTIYPYYATFLSKERQQEIIEDVKGLGTGLYARLGFVAGGICRKEGLYYCPQCAKLDVEKYGEPYIHREHQLEGIDYCPHHEQKLKKYPKQTNSKIEYIRFEFQYMNLNIVEDNDPYKNLAVALAKKAYQLLKLPLHQLNRKDMRLKYYSLLKEENLITANNRIRQRELFEKFIRFYTGDFLKKYESSINFDYEYNWLKVLLRNSKRHVHPFRHLLFLHLFLDDLDILNTTSKYTTAFGKGPFPCLNKAANHYKKFIISDVKVTRDYKSKYLIGTFECSCGFIYSRKNNTDQFRIGRVKQFGHVWGKRLQELSKKDLSVRAMARELGVDSQTVKKYLNQQLAENDCAEEKIVSEEKLIHYKKQWLEICELYPQLNRTALRQKNKAAYTFLYRYDKDWLMSHCPELQRKKEVTFIVDWHQRDLEYTKKIKALYKETLRLKNPVRITISYLGKQLGILANLEHHLNKLPLTAGLLSKITETTEEFQIRRSYKIIDNLIEQDEPIDLWRIQREAGIKSHHFRKIKYKLNLYIEQKRISKSNIL